MAVYSDGGLCERSYIDFPLYEPFRPRELNALFVVESIFPPV